MSEDSAQTGVKSFNCPQCGGAVSIRAAGLSTTAVCQHCSSVIDIANDQLRIIAEADSRAREIPLPLGSRGTLQGHAWEVIGFMVRSDATEVYTWREYLLFNPWQGFRFLVENQGHWSFVAMLRQSLDIWVAFVRHAGRNYRLFGTTNAKVLYVMGEFYWRVRVGERCHIRDYVAPPYMLSSEQNAQELTWSEGVYIDSAVVRDAFGIQGDWPEPSGIAPNQPNPFGATLSRNLRRFAAFLLVLLLAQCAMVAGSRNAVLLSKSYALTSAQISVPQVLGTLEVPGGQENLEIEVMSPVKNQWFELEVELINKTTGDRYSLIETVEYYAGYDSDGAWSEGGQSQNAVISSLPGGQYDLVVTPNTDALIRVSDPNFNLIYPGSDTRSLPYSIAIRRDVPVWSNFLVALIIISILPLLQLLRQSAFERDRWEESAMEAMPDYGDNNNSDDPRARLAGILSQVMRAASNRRNSNEDHFT
jgi:hypothetical protein